jgi:hypothetical protein
MSSLKQYGGDADHYKISLFSKTDAELITELDYINQNINRLEQERDDLAKNVDEVGLKPIEYEIITYKSCIGLIHEIISNRKKVAEKAKLTPQERQEEQKYERQRRAERYNSRHGKGRNTNEDDE